MGILHKTDTRSKSFTKKHLLSMVFLGLFAITTLTQVFALPVSAAIDPRSNPRDYAQAATLYNSMVMCVERYTPNSVGAGTWWLRNGAGDFFNNDNAVSGNWWNDGTSAASPWTSASFINTNTASIPHTERDGRVHCNDTVKAGAKAWGFSSPLDLLCSAGIKRDGGGSCENGSTEHGFKLKTGHADQIAAAIRDRAFGGNEPQLTGAHNYLLYYTAFTAENGCAAVAADTGSGDRNYPDIKTVGDGGSIQSIRYEARESGHDVYVYATNGSEVDQNCGEIAAAINQYAQAYADLVEEEGLDANIGVGGGEGGEDAYTNTCGVDSGWFICPVITTTAKITDGLYDHIISLFVRVPPISTDTSEDNGIYQGWKSFRNIANVAFIIAFMIIIYSQVTGAGVSNYGIKKLLPRLIIAALLVNVSYWISAIAVDLSNILGASLSEFLDAIDTQMSIQNVPGWTDLLTFLLSLGTVAVGIAGVAGIATVGLAPELALTLVGLIAPFMIGALLAIVVAVIILVLRQAAIIIFVMISPLAFVAMLLPNTERWFTKWRQWFISFLLLYPAVAILFGGAKIAGQVLANAQTSGLATLIAYGSALFVTAAPLFLIPFMVRQYGGNGIDKLGAKIQSKASGLGKSASKPFDSMRQQNMKRASANIRRRSFEKVPTEKKGEDGKELTRFKRTGGVGRFIRYSERRKTETEGQESEAGRASKSYITEELNDDKSFRERVSGTSGAAKDDLTALASRNRVLARAMTEEDKAEDEDVSNAGIILLSENLSGSERKQLALSGSVDILEKDHEGNAIIKTDASGKTVYELDENGEFKLDKNGDKIPAYKVRKTLVADDAMRKAAIDAVFKQGSFGEGMEIVEQSGGTLSKFNTRISSNVPSFAGKNPAIGGATIDVVSTGGIRNKLEAQRSTVNRGINTGRFEAKDFASVGASALSYNYEAVKAMLESENADDRKAGLEAKARLQEAAIGALSSPQLASAFDGSSERQKVVKDLFGASFEDVKANTTKYHQTVPKIVKTNDGVSLVPRQPAPDQNTGSGKPPTEQKLTIQRDEPTQGEVRQAAQQEASRNTAQQSPAPQQPPAQSRGQVRDSGLVVPPTTTYSSKAPAPSSDTWPGGTYRGSDQTRGPVSPPPPPTPDNNSPNQDNN